MAADKAGDEDIGRRLENLARRAGLTNLALIHDDHQIGQGHRLVLAMRDMDEGDAELALQPLQLLAHPHAQKRVEGGERLVE